MFRGLRFRGLQKCYAHYQWQWVLCFRLVMGTRPLTVCQDWVFEGPWSSQDQDHCFLKCNRDRVGLSRDQVFKDLKKMESPQLAFNRCTVLFNHSIFTDSLDIQTNIWTSRSDHNWETLLIHGAAPMDGCHNASALNWMWLCLQTACSSCLHFVINGCEYWHTKKQWKKSPHELTLKLRVLLLPPQA